MKNQLTINKLIKKKKDIIIIYRSHLIQRLVVQKTLLINIIQGLYKLFRTLTHPLQFIDTEPNQLHRRYM